MGREQIETRSLTAVERNVLRGHVRSQSLAETLLGTGILFAVAVVVIAGFGMAIGVKQSIGIVAAIGTGACVAGVYYYVKAVRLRGSAEAVADLKKGVAEVCRFATGKVLLVEEFEDNGPGAYVDIGEGKLLYLAGPYLENMLRDRRFPCTEFEVAYALQSQLVVGVYCNGDYLGPIATRRSFTEAEALGGHAPSDGAILSGNIQSLLEAG